MSDPALSPPDPTIPPHNVLVEFWRAQQDPRVPPYRLLSDYWDGVLMGLHIVGPDTLVHWANPYDYESLGLTAEEYVGKPIGNVHAEPEKLAYILGRLGAGQPVDCKAKLKHKDGSLVVVRIVSCGRFEHGALAGTRCATLNITEQERLLEEKERLLDAIQQLEAPIVTIGRGILLVPIIGLVDSRRAEVLTAKLLQRINDEGARFALLDLTGLAVVDTAIADHLLKTARTVSLLGSQAIITGLRAGVAQTLVDLGVDLTALVTLGTVEHGLRWCERRRG